LFTLRPYYQDGSVTLYLGNCLEITAWLAADVLVTDPPYGIGWTKGLNRRAKSRAHEGIKGDSDTSIRDAALSLWGARPAVIFGSFYAAQPASIRQVLGYLKQPDSGVVGSTTGYRRDLEPVFLTGDWPHRNAQQSSLIATRSRNAGNPSSPAGRTGHPHAKPLDVMEQLIVTAPSGVVADPFAGSGSTLVAAKALGRRAIGVEIEEPYCEIAARRLAQDVLDFNDTKISGRL
jgi:site-specific DNA-methyltransferase (adenine-specific)